LSEAAAYAKRGKRFLAREIKAGRLRAARVGQKREYHLTRAWIDEWLSRQSEILNELAVPGPSPLEENPEFQELVRRLNRLAGTSRPNPQASDELRGE
jgi:excisionase family DNA binding protein